MAKRVFQMRDKHLSTTNLYPKQIEQSLPEGVVPVAPEPETYEPTGEEPVAQYITIGGNVYKVGGTDVIANPTLAGTEADLEGLQVGDTKYKVGGGTDFPLIELDGSQITYNPTQYHFTEEQFNIIINNSLLYIKIGSLGEKSLYTVTGGTLSPLSLTRVRRDSETSIFIYGIVVDLTTKVGTYYEGNMQRRLYQHNIYIEKQSVYGNNYVWLTIINNKGNSMNYNDIKSYLSEEGFTSLLGRIYSNAHGIFERDTSTNSGIIVGIYVDTSSSLIKSRIFKIGSCIWAGDETILDTATVTDEVIAL